MSQEPPRPASAAHPDLHHHAAESYLRFEHWLRLQHHLYPGLFGAGITARKPDTCIFRGNQRQHQHQQKNQQQQRKQQQQCRCSVEPTVSLERRQQDGTACVRIDGAPVAICDGCGALLRCCNRNDASDTPATWRMQQHPHILCPHCGFCTVLGGLRRALGLGAESAGLAMPVSAARALVLEALGPDRATHVLGGHRDWLRDVCERRRALNQLFAVIGGITEEEDNERRRCCKPEGDDALDAALGGDQHDCARPLNSLEATMREGEQLLDAILSYMTPMDPVETTPRDKPVSTLALQQQSCPFLSQQQAQQATASKRLAICYAPVLWSPCAGSAAMAEVDPCIVAARDASQSILLVNEAVALYENMGLCVSRSAEEAIRKRLDDIAVTLKSLRSKVRRHRYRHGDLRCQRNRFKDMDSDSRPS
jgi:hypothetical protein